MVIFNALLNLRELKELYSGKPVCVCPLYNGVINTPKTYEATGNPIVIPEYKSLVKLTTTFSPKQAGTGDPSPENVRPISGYDSVIVNVRGRNLCDPEELVEGILNRAGDVVSNKFYKTTGFISVVAGAKVSRTFTNAVGNFFYDAEKNFIESISSTGANISVPENVTYWRFSLIIGTSDIMVNFGEALLPYEPYQPGTTATLTLPETIYGGTVNAVTGAGSKTWGFIASYNGEALPGEWISDRDVYAPGTTPTTGAQVAYKLATPEPFKVSQVSIPSLRGENTFFTNGKNMDIIYKKETFWSDEA